MSAKRINPRRVKLHRPYTVEEAAQALGAHKNSVRAWIKGGLPVVSKSRPILIMGHDLRSHLEARRAKAKRRCQPGTMYCFRCREPRPPAEGMVEFQLHHGATGNLKAICGDCGTRMHRRANASALPAIMPDLDVQIRQADARLIERPSPSLNCDNRKA